MNRFHLPYIDKEKCLAWSVDKPPCRAACPLDIDIEGYIREIARGRPEKAIALIREKCPLPSICGRVCHHPCESACKRGRVDEPLVVEALKRFAADFDLGIPVPADRESHTETVGIVGSGPAGLTAAHDLAGMGYRVTIYEASEEAGGMLALGIPEFKLPLYIVRKEIEAIKSLGVEIKTGVRVGEAVPASDLYKKHHALLIACGLHADVRLDIPGTDFEGVIHALPFLRKIKLGERITLEERVAVIGGGNGAIDAARTALRLEAAQVHLISTRKRNDMPAFEQWVRWAVDEGVVVHNSLIPEAIQGGQGGWVSGIELRRVIHTERDMNGKVVRVLDKGPGSVITMEVDHVVVATGQKPDLGFISDLGIELNRRGAISVDPATQATSVVGVFAAGDAADGPRTITDSMAAGRCSAASIDRYLRGIDPERADVPVSVRTGEEILPGFGKLTNVRRPKMKTLSLEERASTFKEVEQGFSRKEAEQEAARCLRCGTCLRCFEATRCIALSNAENRSKVSPMVDGDLCAGCGRCARGCIYHHIHLVELR